MPLNERQVRQAIEDALGIRRVHTQELQTTGYLNLRGQPFRFSDVLSPTVGVDSAGGIHFPFVAGDDRLRVYPGPVDAVVELTTWATLDVGEWGIIASGSTAGNADAPLPSATSSTQKVYEIHEILQTLIADANAASRVMTILGVAGMPIATGAWTVLDDFAYTGPTLTLSQQGRHYIPRAPGLRQLNDNGTITTADDSMLPALLSDSTGTITSRITAGLAGDQHRIAAVVKRVA